MAGGEFEGVEDRLRDAGRWLEPTDDCAGTRTPPEGMVVVDKGELARLPGAIEMYHAGLALVRGDVPATIDHAQRAIDRAAEADDLTRAGASALMGLARWGGGDLEAAHRAYSVDDAARLLARLLQAAEAGERTGSALEILVLQALTDQARGDVPGALAALERALTLAEPEGYVRVFAGEGPPMASLLRRVAKQRPAWDYVRRLLHACTRAGGTAVVGQTTPGGQRLVEPLSERELDVLRLLESDLDGPDIARELTVSLNTLRTHTKSIYAKLGVNSRRPRCVKPPSSTSCRAPGNG
jgi:DNA-binding CsgD family transcriptional regulator